MTTRLLVVSHKYPPYASGGLAPYVQRSLAALLRCRPRLAVTLFTLDYPAGLRGARLEPHGLLVVRPGVPGWLRRRFLDRERDFRSAGRLWFGVTLAWFNLRVLARLVAEVRRSGRDGVLVSVHDWQSSPVAVAAATLLRLPVAYHVHNTEFTMTAAGRAQDPLGMIRWFERRAGHAATVVVVPTRRMRDLLAEAGWDVRRVVVVPHGYEAPGLGAHRDADEATRRARSERLRRRLGVADGAPVVVFAGRLSPVKGIGTLVRALPAVVAAHPGTRLLVLGVGFPGTTESEDVRRLVAATGMSEHVHVYDAYLPTAEVLDHFELADVCAFPSIFEPFGLVAVEAMALGRPVLLGPGFADVVAVGDGGPVAFRTGSDSPVELADALHRVLSDPVAAAAMAGRGRRHVDLRLSWARSSEELLTAYDRATGPARQPVPAQEATC